MALPESFLNVCDTLPPEGGTGQVCETLAAQNASQKAFCAFRNWFADPNGNPSAEFIAFLTSAGIGTPVGNIEWRPVSSVPTGWLIANGQTVSRTTYASLFSVYGTTFGSGNGTTTFNVPDLQGRFLLGSSAGHPVGEADGEENVTLTAAQLASHTHTPTPEKIEDTGSGDVAGPTLYGGTLGSGPLYGSLAIGSAGGDEPHNNMPPFKSGLWLIKAL
jgi:microcystin-dependent protein